MFDIQEQEERDHGREFSNDSQMAYAHSNILFDGNRVGEIPAGMFAVVVCSVAYCPTTDAVLHHHNRSLHRLCGSRRVADYASKLRALVDHEDGEQWIEVEPKAPCAPLPLLADDADIPF